MLFHKSTSEGLIVRNSNKNERPFVLSRSFFAGSQKYGAIWTGDNEASWSHLQIATPMLLSLNIAALSFVGADVGGFFGNPDAELMTRWMQAGAYQPFFRGHAHHDAKRREPWMFGEEWMVKMREAAMSRYALLPYWYTVFKEAEISGMPVMRMMWMEYPKHEELYSLDDQYLIGSDMLVKPVTSSGVKETDIVFPCEDSWYDVDTMNKIQLGQKDEVSTVTVESDIDKIPVYQRGGSIISRKLRLRRSTQMMTTDPYTLFVALNDSRQAKGSLYVDDEHSFDYKRKAQFRIANFDVDFNDDGFIKNVMTDGSSSTELFKSTNHMIERIILMGVERSPSSLTVRSTALDFQFNEESNIVVIRKPNISAVDNWAISVKI